MTRSPIGEGDRIIEVGIGTGLSLPLYPSGCKIVGIDVTRKMLEKAQKKKAQQKLSASRSGPRASKKMSLMILRPCRLRTDNPVRIF